jgi:hypothetical protein
MVVYRILRTRSSLTAGYPLYLMDRNPELTCGGVRGLQQRTLVSFLGRLGTLGDSSEGPDQTRVYEQT